MVKSVCFPKACFPKLQLWRRSCAGSRPPAVETRLVLLLFDVHQEGRGGRRYVLGCFPFPLCHQKSS